MSTKSSLINRIKGLYCITGQTRNGLSYEEIVRQMCLGGCDVVQFRAKNLIPAELIRIGRKLRLITKRYKVPLIVNDRPDIAVILQADGVHLGQDDLPLDVVLNVVQGFSLAKKLITGISTHSINEALKAEKDGADYISFGPIFRSSTKPELKPVGLELLKKVKSKVSIPVVAIGGINEKNINDVRATGVDAVGVISAVCNERNIRNATMELKEKIGNSYYDTN